MRKERPSSERQHLVSSFLEIAVGQTAEIALQFLQAAGWKLEEALHLFYVGGETGGSSSTAEAPVSVMEEDARNGPAINDSQGEVEEVRAPLPVKRDVLYDGAAYYGDIQEEARKSATWESFRNGSLDNLASLYRPPFGLMHRGPFDKAKSDASLQDKWLLVNLQSIKEFSSHMLNRDTWSNEAVEQTIRRNFIFWQVHDDTSEGKKVCTYYNLVSIPAVLVIDPITGQKMRAWSGMVHPERLLEDLLPYLDKGPKEHHVPTLRKRPREGSHNTASTDDKIFEEEEEIRRSIAATSLDGRKKHRAEISEEDEQIQSSIEATLFDGTKKCKAAADKHHEDDENIQRSLASTSLDDRKSCGRAPVHAKESGSKKLRTRGNAKQKLRAPVHAEESAAALRDHRAKRKDAVDIKEQRSKNVRARGNEKLKAVVDEGAKMEKDDTISKIAYPPLPDEPCGDKALLCKVAIKLPDGRRLERNFRLSDPVQLLWSFCCKHLEEASTRPFRFTHAIPREPRWLECGSNLTFAESNLSNTMILLMWE